MEVLITFVQPSLPGFGFSIHVGTTYIIYVPILTISLSAQQKSCLHAHTLLEKCIAFGLLLLTIRSTYWANGVKEENQSVVVTAGCLSTVIH